jgi:hypothetical protein
MSQARDIIARARQQVALNGLSIRTADEAASDVLVIAAELEVARDALRTNDPAKMAAALARASEALGG